MNAERMPEYWMRGPVPGIDALLQPVAHALLQAQEEIHAMVNDFPGTGLWQRPAGVASVGFHLQHLAGVLNRLFTYARGEALTTGQLDYLAAEGKPSEGITIAALMAALDTQLAACFEQLKATPPATLTEPRAVGRKQLPSTVIGLLFHAAEHTMRHTGQLLVTVRVLKKEGGN